MSHPESERIVIADPGLIDSTGHHLGYSWSVAQSALARGLPAVILASRRFSPPRSETDMRCVPVFESLYQTAARPSRMRTLSYGLASRLPDALGHRLAESLRAGRRLVRRAQAERDRFGGELAAALTAIGGAGRDCVLLHSISAANLDSLPSALRPDGVGALAVVLRRTPQEMDTTDAAPRPVAAVLRDLRAHFGPRLRLYADTAELAGVYGGLTRAPVAVVPLPVQVPEPRPHDGGPPHLVFAGGARAEKGYVLLPPLVRHLAGRARFTIHSGPITAGSDPMVQRAHRALLAQAGPMLALIQHPLPPEDYLALIGQADLLLLPYDATAYGPRSSGILAEARAMGVPATVPAGTWMETAAGPAHEVVFDGPDDFIPAVERTLRVLPALRDQYRAAAGAWRAIHNPDALLRALLDDGADKSGAGTVPPQVVSLRA
ncbi:MAG: hypothetical protein AB7F35_05410 [Acetobacteraceae bacterium]